MLLPPDLSVVHALHQRLQPHRREPRPVSPGSAPRLRLVWRPITLRVPALRRVRWSG